MTAELTQFSFVRELSRPGLQMFSENLRLQRVQRGRVLVSKGDRIGGAYLVEAGLLRVYQLGPTGREQTLYFAGPGESCIHAVSCLFSDVRYPAWVEVDESDTVVGVVAASAFRTLFASEPAIQRFTFDVLSRRVAELTEALVDAGTLGVEQRIISLLLRRCDEEGRVAMSQDRVARHVGTAREVVSRTLRALGKEGLTASHRGSVEIIDVEGLAARLPRE